MICILVVGLAARDLVNSQAHVQCRLWISLLDSSVNTVRRPWIFISRWMTWRWDLCRLWMKLKLNEECSSRLGCHIMYIVWGWPTLESTEYLFVFLTLPSLPLSVPFIPAIPVYHPSLASRSSPYTFYSLFPSFLSPPSLSFFNFLLLASLFQWSRNGREAMPPLITGEEFICT